MKKLTWKIKTLKQLGSFSKGKGISKADILPEGLPCIRYAEIYTKYDFQAQDFSSYISKKVADKSRPVAFGDILFAGSGETSTEIGKSLAYLGKIQSYAGGDIIILRLNKDINPLFISYYLNTLGRKQLNRLGEGQSIVHIYAPDLSKVTVPVPPIAEQKRIVEVLETWDKAISLTKRLIEQKKLQKKYLMQQLLTGRTRLKGFKKKYRVYKLGNFALIYQPKTISTQQLILNGKYPVFGANGAIGFYSDFNHKTWQILVTCRGATCGTVNRTYGPAWITGNAMVINSDKNCHIDKLFLFYLLLNKDFRPLISGSGQPQIVREPLVNLSITVPDLNEQKQIAKVLANADRGLDLLQQKLSKLQEQKKGLMQVLLTGKVRLSGDSVND